MKEYSFCLCLLMLCLAAGIGSAQESRAVVLGRVTDSSGAGVPGAKVIARSLDTGVSTSSVANEDGGYQLNYLQPGHTKFRSRRRASRRWRAIR